MLGSGPWVIENYQPSTHIHYKRNPEWHFKGRPFMDRVQQAILPDYATRVAQFRAHRIHFGVLRQEEIVATKKEMPQLNLVKLGLKPVGYPIWIFGLRPNSPFKDERVRQAISMSLDREILIDVFSNVSNFRKEGLDVETRIFNHMGLSPRKFWLNPESPEFGANAKYFKFDIAEAKRLASAAGFGAGTKTTFSHTGALSNQFAAAQDMIRQNLGWELEDRVLTPTNTLLDMKGDFDGMTNSTYSERADPGVYLYHKYHTDGSSKRVPAGIDATMDKLLNDQFRITDEKKRIELLHEFQRHMAKTMWKLPLGGKGDIFDLAWPEFKNYAVFNASYPEVDATELMGLHYWLDQTPA
jgi:ABC-type transport system substrate-binding protein